ncbi:hypothetical protein F5883DRAFT_650103 [Diaporthe sp. PMI_573]|nr:hypothetical protein F5883DRAFT_650103 [Diaporthaceae sp. PMI_573]
MAAHAGLPDLNTLEVFSYYDPDPDAMIDIISDDDTHPRIIEDYVIDPIDWQAKIRGVNYGNGIGPPNGVNTVEGILAFKTKTLVCFVCGQKSTKCNGDVCVDIAKDLLQDVAEFNLQIRPGRWGYGVFALANIPRGTLIGEYLGRLIPLDTAHPRDARYTYTIEGRTECDGQQYGNITRYINHNCKCNTDPMTVMYRNRAAIAFNTNRDIAAGEKIFIDYGITYFDSSMPCECNAFEYPHTSETYRRHVYPDGSVSPRGLGTYGRINGQQRGGKRKKALSGAINKVSKSESASKTRGKAAASKVRQRRRSWGSMKYKGGDPDSSSLRRSARLAAASVDA